VSIVLTLDELRALTGTKQPARMCTWLKARQWPHEPPARRGDWPKVDRAYYLARMSGQQPSTPAAPRQRLRLDFMTNPTAA
jgi:hypothetical protein